METCRPQQSIHVDQFFVSRLSIVWLKKVKRDERKRLAWKKKCKCEGKMSTRATLSVQ